MHVKKKKRSVQLRALGGWSNPLQSEKETVMTLNSGTLAQTLSSWGQIINREGKWQIPDTQVRLPPDIFLSVKISSLSLHLTKISSLALLDGFPSCLHLQRCLNSIISFYF